MAGVMATCTATGGRLLLLRAALLLTTGLVLSIGSPAWARVGVTSGASVPEILVRGVLERLADHGFDFVQPVILASIKQIKHNVPYLEFSSLPRVSIGFSPIG